MFNKLISTKLSLMMSVLMLSIVLMYLCLLTSEIVVANGDAIIIVGDSDTFLGAFEVDMIVFVVNSRLLTFVFGVSILEIFIPADIFLVVFLCNIADPFLLLITAQLYVVIVELFDFRV